MALISCPECGQSISDRAVSCPHCGCPIGESSEKVKVTVTMATQRFLINAIVSIYLNGSKVGEVGDGQSFSFTVDKGNAEVRLKGNLREKVLSFDAQNDTQISAHWNRITGKLEAEIFTT